MENDSNACLEGGCAWGLWEDEFGCGHGSGGCALANFLECEESNFHDANLVKATTAIRAILSLIPPDPRGRNLSLVQTNLGVVLAWVDHSNEPRTGGITKDSDNETVISALKIKLPTAY